MGLRKSPPWVQVQKELEAKGYKFNDKGECLHDPTRGELPLPPVKREQPKPQEPAKKVDQAAIDKRNKAAEDNEMIVRSQAKHKVQQKSKTNKRGK